MSAADARPGFDATAGVTLAAAAADMTELAALRDREQVLKALAARRGIGLPPLGRIVAARDTLVLSVRPGRWLLLTPPGAPGATAAQWQEACAGTAAVIDLSSALVMLQVAGPNAREALLRGCRLDLDPEVFPAGHAAATAMAQVAALLAALPSGMLILTPASTGRHFREWLAAAARPFGLAPRGDVTVAALSGESHS